MKRSPQKSRLFRTLGAGLGLALAAAGSLVGAAPAMAVPATTYTVSGTVIDADAGLPLPGAGIMVDDGASALTDADGAFSVSLLPGAYTYSVAADGYTAQTGDFTVDAGDVDLGSISLTAEAPVETEPATFSISGVVTAKDGNADFAPTVTLDGVTDSSPELADVDETGAFEFTNVAANPDLTVTFEAEGYQTVVKDVPVTDENVTVNVELLPNLPELPAGTVAITGTAAVGQTLTAKTSGWPAGTTLSYQWGFSTGQSGGPIDGATKSTLTLTDDLAGLQISVFVTGSKDGFAPSVASVFGPTVGVAKKDAAPAPAGDSGGLAVYLKEQGVTPQSQTSAGLPAGDLNPGEDYEAQLDWTAADSYVDVYLYSTPTFVGTFPVVNGVVQITLSAEVLSELESGNHTLVVTGQSSGSVQAVALTVAAMLASTGANAAGPLTAAALLVLLGAALLVVRRRRQQA